MHFEYEITQDEYVAGQLLYSKLSDPRRHAQVVVFCMLTGLALAATAWIVSELSEDANAWIPILLAALGVWWIYAGMANLFPSRYFRRVYRRTELAGKKFNADLNDRGFEVTGDLCSWRVQWPSVRFKGEDDCVFMLSSEGTIFMFGKKFLSNEQQQELRRLCALGTSDH
jgi:hypothetical protein